MIKPFKHFLILALTAFSLATTPALAHILGGGITQGGGDDGTILSSPSASADIEAALDCSHFQGETVQDVNASEDKSLLELGQDETVSTPICDELPQELDDLQPSAAQP